MDSLSVLVIDDDADYTNLMQLKLQSWGHEVVIANNWLSAMMLLGRNDFDVALVDVETPTGNGLTACKDLCCDPKIAAMAKIVITGRSDEDTVRQCNELGAVHISKGAKVMDELKTHLVTLVDRKNAVAV